MSPSTVAEMARCEHLRAYPAGRVDACDRAATQSFGWRELCYEHWLDMLRRPDLRPSLTRGEQRQTRYEAENRGVFLTDEEAKFREVLTTISSAPDLHGTTQVP